MIMEYWVVYYDLYKGKKTSYYLGPTDIGPAFGAYFSETPKFRKQEKLGQLLITWSPIVTYGIQHVAEVSVDAKRFWPWLGYKRGHYYACSVCRKGACKLYRSTWHARTALYCEGCAKEQMRAILHHVDHHDERIVVANLPNPQPAIPVNFRYLGDDGDGTSFHDNWYMGIPLPNPSDDFISEDDSNYTKGMVWWNALPRGTPLAEALEEVRAGGGVVCTTCGQEYQWHPLDGPEGLAGKYLNRICDGRLVKL